jgi:transposase
MLTLPSSVRVYLAAQPVDLRRGHDGLVALVRSTWRLNPFDGHLFVFLGRRLDRVKILVWDRNGFVLYYKRLSQGRFRMPSIPAGATRVEMDATTLAMLLDGIDVRQVRRPVAWSPPPPAVGASAPPA